MAKTQSEVLRDRRGRAMDLADRIALALGVSADQVLIDGIGHVVLTPEIAKLVADRLEGSK